MSKRIFDFWVVTLLVVASAFLWDMFALKPLIGSFLMLGVPTAYLFYRKKKNYKKILLGTVILGLLLGFFFDFIETLNGAWEVTNLFFPYLLLGVMPLDDLIWFGLTTALTLTFYEHFIDDEKNAHPSYRWKELLAAAIGVVLVLILAYLYHPDTLYFSYPYLKGGLAAILLPIIFIVLHPKCITKFAKLCLFFLFVYFLMEYVAVKAGGWTFATQGQYIGWVSLLGVSFPIEELFFWMLWYAAGTVAYYEYFIDDGK